MPYRRLPKTDLTRIKALQQAISMEGFKEKGQLVLSYQTIRDAQQMLSKFRNIQGQCDQYSSQYRNALKSFKDETKIAKMYVTHFLKVLLMAIERGELRSDILPGYGLDPDSGKLPALPTEEEIAEWGKKVIEGEEKRIQHGGVPIYNPNIAKVKVYYSIFADHFYSISVLKQNAEKYHQALVQMRPLVDDLLLDIWNQVELYYNNQPLSILIAKTAPFGLIYYLRTSEKKQLEAEKLQGYLF